MQLYLAPMEEITGFIFRNVTDSFFPGADKFITPFVSPNQENILKTRDGREINPDHNIGKNVAIQVMSNQADAFLELAFYLKELGYKEINLNFGCPSGTVVKKYRGSGIFQDLDMLRSFLDAVFASELSKSVDISVKTRVGYNTDEYWDEIINIYNRYPISELTVHPRIGTDFYKGSPRMEAWEYALAHYNGKLCYNGDVISAKDYHDFSDKYDSEKVNAVMIGRGAVGNPGIFREIVTGEKMTLEELKQWHDALYGEYENRFSSKDGLFKMKEVWFYLANAFEDIDKPLKNIRKCTGKAEYFAAVREIWRAKYCGTEHVTHW